MKTFLIGALAVALLGAGGAAGSRLGGESNAFESLSAVSTQGGGTTTVDDRGTTTVDDRRATTVDDRNARHGKRSHRRGRGPGRRGRAHRTESVRHTRTVGEDVRGPCDEAEHAGDPRCVSGRDGDDRRGSRGRSGRRGGNSGRH